MDTLDAIYEPATATQNAKGGKKPSSPDWSPDFASPSVLARPKPERKICLATNYLLMTESTRRMWADLGKHLEEEGCRLVLLSTTLPDQPLPFPVFQHPYLMRDFAAAFPGGEYDALSASPREMEWLKADMSRVAAGYSLSETLRGLASFRSYSNELLRTLQPSFVLIADNTLCQTALMQRACWDANLPVQIYERGLLPETLMLESRGIQAWSDMRTHWLAQEIPAADPAAYEKIRSYYLSRRPQKYNQPDFSGGGEELRRQLGLEGKKVVVFLGGGYEANGHAPQGGNYERQFFPAFPTTNDALLELSAAVGRIANTALVFKPHPLDPDPYVVARVQGVNIVKDVNVHALIEAADVVAAQYTTLQFEAALYEKPILLLARSAWWGRNAAYEVNRREDLVEMTKAALERRDWSTRRANAHAFVTWMMDRFLISHADSVPARRNLRDLARFIAATSFDTHGLASAEERCARAQEALRLRRHVPAPAPQSQA